jgi:hypothetical protein
MRSEENAKCESQKASQKKVVQIFRKKVIALNTAVSGSQK